MKKSRGFTFIEILLVVAIIGILAAVGLPAYFDQVRKAHRADAQSLLMNIATRQQQTLLDSRAYAADVPSLNIPIAPSVSTFYTVTVAVGTGTVPSFTATASPLGSQQKDKCGDLSINNAGVKTPSTCW